MALRVDASGDGLASSSGLPALTTFTVAGWCYIVADRGGTLIQPLFSFDTTNGYMEVFWDDGFDGFGFESYNNPADASGLAASRPAVGTWFYAFLRCAGAGASQLDCGWAAVAGTSFTKATGTSQGGTVSNFRVGKDTNAAWSSARFAAVKVWDAVLTDAELLNEMATIQPKRWTNLNRWHPMVHDTAANAALDFGGNARPLTVTGTLTIEDGPPIGWGAPSGMIGPLSSGAVYNQSLSITSTPVPGVVRQGGKLLNINTTAVPSLVRAVGKIAAILTTPVPVIRRAFSRTWSIASTPVPAVTAAKVKLVTLSIVSTPVAAIARSVGKVIAIAATPVPAITRAVGKVVSILSTPIPLIRRALSKALSITSAPVPKVVRSTARALSIVTLPAPAISRSVGKPISINSTPAPNISRSIIKALRITSAPVPGLSALKVRLITLSITTTPVPSIRRSIGKRLSAIANGIAALFFTPRFEGPVAPYPWHPPGFFIPPYGFGPVGMGYLPIWAAPMAPMTTWTAAADLSSTWSAPAAPTTVWRG